MNSQLVAIDGMREAPAKLHFALIPLMSQGHMIPMLDIARLLAERGATVTYITTPINAARINRVSGLPIRFAELPFPAAAASLPEGCENVDLVPSKELLIPFFSRALSLFREVVEDYLRQGQLLNLLPSPSCIIADSCITWAGPVARSIGARHLVFHGPSCFSLLCSMLIDRHKVLQTVADDLEHFVVPELPYKIVVNRAQAPGWFNTLGLEKMRQEIFAGEAAADGVVLNSCEELELYFIEKYREAMGKKIAVWPIGPLSLCNKDFDSKAARGNPAAIDVELLLSWLDAKVAGSVVFVSFGSISRTPPRQLMEVGCGLETSGYPFVWVVKESGSFSCPEVERWMKEFEQRTTKEQRGLIVKGWAPQLVILSHPAVGGFMTHCGWNSTLEALAAGVPVATWPQFADQFLNERLVADVLGVGVAVGAKLPAKFLDEKRMEAPAITRKDVKKAVMRLMDEGLDGEGRRKKARELGEMARRAMEEGGSSHLNMNSLIQYVYEATQAHKF